MKARIYRPAKNAMQSGTANTQRWVLEFAPEAPLVTEPLMGWSASTDTTRQVRMSFESEEAAIDYAKRNFIEYELKEPKIRVFRPKSYAANFASNRVE